MICYCKQEIAEGARQIQVDLYVKWGADDLRDDPELKEYVFHSFGCLADWANDRAAAHDGVTVREGAPEGEHHASS